MLIFRLSVTNSMRVFVPVGRHFDFDDIVNPHLKMADSWEEEQIKLSNQVEDNTEKPFMDFIVLYNSYIACSEKAASVLRSLADADTLELLPLRDVATDTPYYLMHVIKEVDCLDYDASEFLYSKITGSLKKITKKVFRKDCLEGIHIFRIPENSVTYVTDTFKQTIEEHGFEGLKFTEINAEWL